MTVAIYMDVHVPRAITEGLRLRDVNVLTAQEDGRARASDAELLDRAADLGRILFSFDDDLPREATKKLAAGQHFAGLLFAHPLRITIGQCVRDLELIAKVADPQDLADRIEFLPLD